MTRRYSGVEPLGPEHEVAGFDCGSMAQTEWLRRHALQAHRSETSKVYVVRRLDDEEVVGFHALATGAVLASDAPSRVTKGAGGYAVPVVILTRLGVDRSEQGQGLGRALLVDALRRVAAAGDIVGVRALLIHAEDQEARDFYDHHAEFAPSPTDPLHLFLLMKDLRRQVSEAGLGR